MAFLSAVWDGTIEHAGFTQGESYSVYVPLGYDDQKPLTYFMFVYIQPSDKGTEFAFGIVVHNRETEESETYYDASVSNEFFPKSIFPKLREILWSLAERAVRATNRSAFYMVTFCRYLPEKALVKYFTLCEIFTLCGYDVTRSEPEPGTHLWVMSRADVTDISATSDAP